MGSPRELKIIQLMKGPTVHSEVHLKPSSWIYIYRISLKITYPFHPGLWEPLQGRSLLEVSKGFFCLLNKMLCRHCRIQNTPAEHQNANEVLDTECGREGGGK